jgi:adenosylcobinamide kinase / adenosylcobinamide-phosphate guanylyltransferase
MAEIVLILGGARSGKSRFAEQLARRLGGKEVLFLATAEPADSEMVRRIGFHRASRPHGWQTLETPRNVGPALEQADPTHKIVLIDCLTLLVSNILLSCGEVPKPDLAEERVSAELSTLLQACKLRQGTVVIVSGEVGSGLVPESSLGRLFRDLLGRANQAVAAQSSAAYLLIAGIPVELKTLAVSIEQAAKSLCESEER